MSEQVSAVSSIADACEFRFARFYIVCEAMTLGTPGSPLIVCNLRTHLVEYSKLGKTRIIENVKHDAARNAGFGG